jgi:cytochrome o ubiquinol oxidase subunit 3
MYIRTFKPADGSPWVLKSIIHLLVFAIVTVAGIKALLGGVHAFQAHGVGSDALLELVHHDLPALITTLVGFIGLLLLARSGKKVEFGEANAIDVESMGLYWHFVDIVWIVIFTAVYLLEYL